MILDTQPSTRSLGSDDNLIPLINVVFLMLIFFMVAGHIESSDGVQVSPPQSTNQLDVSADKLKIVVTAQSRLFVDGKERTQEELKQQLTDYIEQFSVDETDQALVELKADSQLTAEGLQAVLLQIKSAGINRISLLTESLEQQVI